MRVNKSMFTTVVLGANAEHEAISVEGSHLYDRGNEKVYSFHFYVTSKEDPFGTSDGHLMTVLGTVDEFRIFAQKMFSQAQMSASIKENPELEEAMTSE